MIHPDDPFATRSYRTSRQAYGVSIYFEKPNRDLLWAIGVAVIVAVLFIVAVWMRS